MNILPKILAIIFIFLGEALAIYAEMVAAKNYASGTFRDILIKIILVVFLAGLFLVAGYAAGFKYFKNIWVATAISFTTVLIVEPMLAYTFFHQLPTKGATIGIIFGILGFISAMIF